MFGCWTCLPVDFYVSIIRGMGKHQCVNDHIAELCKWLWEALKKVQAQSTSEAEKQKQYCDRKANAILLETGKLVLAEADACKEKRKVKDQWEEEPCEVEHQVTDGIPSYLMKNQQTGCPWVLCPNWLFLITSARGTPLCTVIWTEQVGCATTTLEEQTPDRSETEKVPQSVDCLPVTQQQTGETPLGWVNRKLCVVLKTYSRDSMLDQE